MAYQSRGTIKFAHSKTSMQTNQRSFYPAAYTSLNEQKILHCYFELWGAQAIMHVSGKPFAEPILNGRTVYKPRRSHRVYKIFTQDIEQYRQLFHAHEQSQTNELLLIISASRNFSFHTLLSKLFSVLDALFISRYIIICVDNDIQRFVWLSLLCALSIRCY